MTDLLLEEPAEGNSILSEQHEQVLIELMCFALKSAALGECPTGRFAVKKSKAKELKQVRFFTINMSSLIVGFNGKIVAVSDEFPIVSLYSFVFCTFCLSLIFRFRTIGPD